MFCIKCGADNLETAKFCRKCGEAVSSQQAAGGSQQSAFSVEPIEIEEETRVAVRRETDNGKRIRESAKERENHPVGEAPPPLLSKEGSRINEEAEIFLISPTLLFVKAGYVGAVVGALLLVGLASAFLWNFVSVGVSVFVGLVLLLVPAFYHVRQKLVSYKLTESTLEMDSGFISKTTRNVPLRRIQDVTVSATPWQRLVGIGDIVIDNASEDTGRVVLKNINAPKRYADQLLQQMRLLEK